MPVIWENPQAKEKRIEQRRTLATSALRMVLWQLGSVCRSRGSGGAGTPVLRYPRITGTPGLRDPGTQVPQDTGTSVHQYPSTQLYLRTDTPKNMLRDPGTLAHGYPRMRVPITLLPPHRVPPMRHWARGGFAVLRSRHSRCNSPLITNVTRLAPKAMPKAFMNYYLTWFKKCYRRKQQRLLPLVVTNLHSAHGR